MTLLQLDPETESLIRETYRDDRHDEAADVVRDALQLWRELENPEEMVDDQPLEPRARP